MPLMEEFKKFALRGNVVDMAVGFTVGAAFATIARSLVDDVIMPPVGMLLGRVDFSDLFILLKASPTMPPPYSTLANAQAAGAVTLNYGRFVNNILTFVIIALVMFFLVRAINRLDAELEEGLGRREEKPAEPASKKCPFCLSTIPYRATRCSHCTSHLELEEAR